MTPGSATSPFGSYITEREKYRMKRKLAYLIAAPLLFFVLAFQGTCHSQCEELVRELRADCKDDLGANSERCREDQQKFQQACREETQGPPQE